MLNQYLGNYLLKNNLIDREVLINLLDHNNKAHVKLGVLAINNNLMTAKQVNEIHGMQKKYDKRFGELAVEKGYLKEKDVEFLLNQQKFKSVELSQLLIDKNIFSFEELEEVLKGYKKENNLTDEQFKAIEKGDQYQGLEVLIQSKFDKLSTDKADICKDYAKLSFRNLVRFIDHQIYIQDSNEKIITNNIVVVFQEMFGDLNINSYLVMEEDTFIDFASRYSKLQINKRDQLAEDSVAEFLNFNNGLFTVNMSEQGKNIMLKPPIILDKANVFNLDSHIIIPFNINKGKIYFVLEIK